MDVTRASLLMRVRDPDNKAAWVEFDSVYRPLLYRYAKVWGLSDADSEDVTQYCMVAIHKHITKFDYDPKKGRFKGWLKTLVSNRARNLVRDARQKQAKSEVFQRIPDPGPSPEEQFDKLWLEEHIRHALKLIREEVEAGSFTAYQAYVLDGRPAEEVCAELSLNTNQLYGIKWRINHKLNAKMTELLDGTEE